MAVGGFLGIAQSVAVGLAGFAAVKNIVDTKIPGDKGTGGGNSPRPTSAPVFNIVSASPTNQLNEALVANNAVPVKAYVVSSEVTSQAALDRRISNAASF